MKEPTRQGSMDTCHHGVSSRFGGVILGPKFLGRIKELQIYLISDKGSESKWPNV